MSRRAVPKPVLSLVEGANTAAHTRGGYSMSRPISLKAKSVTRSTGVAS